MRTTTDLTEVARQLRNVLAELDDPGSEFTASPATRRRIEGAAIALDALAQSAVCDPEA